MIIGLLKGLTPPIFTPVRCQRVQSLASQGLADDSRHFFSAAAEAMRRILIERARQRASLKRGGDRKRVDIDLVEPAVLPLACDDIPRSSLCRRSGAA